MRPLSTLIVLLAAHISAVAAPGGLTLRGTVTDSLTRDPLPAAHVRIAGSTRGTITTHSGEYALQVAPGRYTLIASMIGYRPETTEVALTADAVCSFRLHGIDIILPEIVVTNEDPAVEIIRRAIEAKRHWIDRLVSYQMDAFTRQVIRRDTAIASVAESFTRGYWQQGDTLREVVLQRRQTANIPQAFNFASVGRIINFNDDAVRFFGYTFVGPTAPEALDYYDVHLVRTFRDRDRNIFEIALSPRSRTTPLFRGTVLISDASYALTGVDVEPNEAFQIPFIKEKHLRYKQQFAAYQDEIWLPVDIRIIADATVGMIGVSIPRIGFEQTSVITDYTINPQLPDSVFRKRRLSVDSAATRIDSSFWTSHQVLPLTPEEVHAYASLDSTQSLDVQFGSGSVSLQLGGGNGAVASLIDVADIAFNRVEGVRLGIRLETSVLPVLDLRANLAYAFAGKSSSYLFGGTVFTSDRRILGIGIDGYRKAATRPDAGHYGSLVNSATSLFFKNDYHDYYRNEGWRTYLEVSPTRHLSGSLAFVNEMHTSLPVATDYSFFSRSRQFRPNDAIAEGKMRSVQLSVRIGEPPVPMGLMARNALEFTLEYSHPEFAGSSYDFTRFEGMGTLIVPTFARSALFSPGFTFRVAAGTSGGELPLQRAFVLESASSGIGPPGVMRGMEVREFGGSAYVASSIEHNFRSLPFLALGIPFLYERSVEFILHGGVARAWNPAGLPVNETHGWYSEAGFGFNRVLDLLRMDFTWRLTSPSRFRFTLGVAQIL